MFHFGPPKTVVSNNAPCITAKTLFSYMRYHYIDWKTLFEYVPMSYKRAERMFGTLKGAAKEIVLSSGSD